MNDDKPLEFTIIKREKMDGYVIRFFYGDGKSSEIITLNEIPKGIKLKNHYYIIDSYGYKVEPMRVEDEIKKESEN